MLNCLMKHFQNEIIKNIEEFASLLRTKYMQLHIFVGKKYRRERKGKRKKEKKNERN